MDCRNSELPDMALPWSVSVMRITCDITPPRPKIGPMALAANNPHGLKNML